MKEICVHSVEELRAALAQEGEKTILLRGGLYSVTETLHVTSHTHLRAADGEEVRFAGAVRMDGSRAVRLTGGEIYDRVISEQAKGHIYTLDLSPYADEIPEIRDQYSKNTYLPMVVYQNGTPLTPARFPRVNDPAFPEYRDGFALTAGLEVLGESTVPEEERKGYDRSVRAYVMMTEDVCRRAALYSEKTRRTLHMFSYFTKEWRDQTFRLYDFDPERGRFLLDAPTCNGIGKPKCRYYFFNLPEEIKNPGDCYVDRENRVLYFYPIADPAKSELLLTVTGVPMLDVSGSEDISFTDLSFKYSRGAALYGTDVTWLRIDGCTFFGLSDDAVSLERVSHVSIINNRMSHIGRVGVRIFGAGDFPTLTPGDIRIVNNDIGFVGRVRHTYTGALHLKRCVGVNILHNRLHDCPHMLVNLGEGRSPDVNVTLAYNEIYNAVYECDDSAAVYWGRNPHNLGYVIRNNYFHDIGNGYTKGHSNAIYCDDYAIMAHVYNNVFYRAALPQHDQKHRFSTSGSAIYGRGSFGYIHNNIFVDNPLSCRLGFGNTTSILPRLTAAVGVPYVLEVLGPRTDFFNMESNSSDGVDWLTPLLQDGFFSDTWRRAFRDTIWAPCFEMISDRTIDGARALVEGICGKNYTARILEEHCGEVYDTLLEYLRVLAPVNNRFCGNINIRGSAWTPPIGMRYPLTGDLMYADDAPVDKDIISYDNYTADDDKTDAGVSMFTEYGRNFNLTEDGLAYIRRTIPGFEPFDMTRCGCTARISTDEIPVYEPERFPLPPFAPEYLSADADGKEAFLERLKPAYTVSVGDGRPWSHLERKYEVPNNNGDPFFPYTEEKDTEIAYDESDCIIDRSLLMNPAPTVDIGVKFRLSAGLPQVSPESYDFSRFSCLRVGIRPNEAVSLVWLAAEAAVGGLVYATGKKIDSICDGWDFYEIPLHPTFVNKSFRDLQLRFDMLPSPADPTVRVGYIELVPLS